MSTALATPFQASRRKVNGRNGGKAFRFPKKGKPRGGRINTDWCIGGYLPTVPDRDSDWWTVLRFGLLIVGDESDDEVKLRIIASPEMREFAEKNYSSRYVPEWALQAWGIFVDEGVLGLNARRYV